MMHSATLRAIVLATVLCAIGQSANAAEIKLIASRAVQEAYGELLPAFEKSTGNTVTVSWGGTGDIVKRINDGEIADIVIVTDAAIDGLIKGGKLTGTGSAIVAKSPTGAAIKEGAMKPDLSSAESFKKYLAASKGIVLTPGPSNPALHRMLDKLGLTEAMKTKEVKPAGSEILTDPVVQGKADIVFSQASELIKVKGISYAGPFPPGMEITLTYKAAYHTKAPQLTAAKALVAFLTRPDAAKALNENGLEP